MKRTDFETMGDRQKAFEGLESNRRLPTDAPVLVRLDGRAFHTFCRGLAKPYDERLSRAMIETTKFLVKESHASIGYCQSDEISLAFPNTNTSMMFDGRTQKLCSVLASMAAAKFNQQICASIPEKARLLPVFDARAWGVSDLDKAAEYFIWREADATRNSLTMAAHAYYSHKELHKKGLVQKNEMLLARGVDWNSYPAFFKRGTYIRREAELRALTAAELAQIPEKHRPLGPVVRSVLRELEMPPIASVANVRGVLFSGEPPVEGAYEDAPG